MQENIDIKDESQVALRQVLGVGTATLLVAGNIILDYISKNSFCIFGKLNEH